MMKRLRKEGTQKQPSTPKQTEARTHAKHGAPAEDKPAPDGFRREKDMDITELSTQRVEAERAKCLYAYGHITREKAEEMARPYIDSANEIGKAISKRFGVKHKQITMVGYFR